MNTPTNTPWGYPDVAVQIAPGIISYSCASHGGIWLSPARNALIPLKHRRATFNQQGMAGWYEEDTDWSVPAMFFQREFNAYWERCGFNTTRYREDADLIFAHWLMTSNLPQGAAA